MRATQNKYKKCTLGKAARKREFAVIQRKGLYDAMNSGPCVMAALAFHYMQ